MKRLSCGLVAVCSAMALQAANDDAVVGLYTGFGVEKRDLGASTAYVFTDTVKSGSITISEPGYAELLIVGGGGGGGSTLGGGGGAGGVIHFDRKYLDAGTYAVSVGAGGACGMEGGHSGYNGGDSSFGSFVAIGGGGGGSYGDENTGRGQNGGSGGGASHDYSSGTGYVGQGFDGSRAYGDAAGGGGGAGEAGGEVVYQVNEGEAGVSGKGGDGLFFDIAGEMKWYAGGGGGGAGRSWQFSQWADWGGEGGNGGGGNGANRNTGLPGSNGIAGTGGGGGGGGHAPQTKGGFGGSGVVVLKVCTADLSDAIPDIELRGITLTNGTHSAMVDYRILSLGDCDSVEVVLEYGTDRMRMTSTAELGSVDAIGEYSALIGKLSEDTEYYGRFALFESGELIARSGSFGFRTLRDKGTPVLLESKKGLWEVLIEGSEPDFSTDILNIETGTDDTERHQAECPEMFYTTGSYVNGYTGETYTWPTQIGATWCYSGYVYLHTAGDWKIVSEQFGYVYIAIDGKLVEDWRVAQAQRVYSWVCPGPGWYKFDVRTARSDKGGGNYGGLAFQWEQNDRWEWAKFTKEMLRLDFSDPIEIGSLSYVDGVYKFDCSAVPEAGNELKIRYGKQEDGSDWQIDTLSNASLELTAGEADYYQIFSSVDDVEYSSVVKSFSDARVINAAFPEAAVTGVGNIGATSATIAFDILSCGNEETAKCVFSFGVSAQKLIETIETDDVAVGSGSLTLADLMPSTTYYFSMHPVAADGKIGEETEVMSFTTAADPTYVAAGDRPQFADGFTMDGTGGDICLINAALAYDAGEAISVFVEISIHDDMSDSAIHYLGDFRSTDTISKTIGDVQPGTRYYARLLGYPASGKGGATARSSMVTAGAAAIYGSAQDSVLYQSSYSLTLLDVGVGGKAVVSFVLDDAVVETREITDPGSYEFSYIHDALGEHTYQFIVDSVCAGGTKISASTARTSYKLRQNTTYSWIGDVDGAWGDSANWYCQAAINQNRDCGYPDGSEVSVDFSRVTSKARVAVDGNYTVYRISPCAENVEIVLAGSDATGITILHRVDGDLLNRSKGSRLVFDDGALTVTDEFIVPVGCTYVLTNTCAASLLGNGFATIRENDSALELYDSSIYLQGMLQMHGDGTRVLIDNSTLNCSQVRFPIFAEDRNNEIRIAGAGSVLCARDDFHVGDVGENDGSSRIVFDVPADGYNDIPLIGWNPNSRFNPENHAINIVIGRSSPMFGVGKLDNEVLLDFARGSISNAKMTLSSERSPNMVDLAYLYADDATEPPTETALPLKLAVSYHASGMIIIVR